MKAAISVIILYKWHVILKIAGQKLKFYVTTTSLLVTEMTLLWNHAKIESFTKNVRAEVKMLWNMHFQNKWFEWLNKIERHNV